MQINGVGNSQSSELRYRNNRPQYQSASDKTADNEESVILTLSSKATAEVKKAATATNVKPKEEAGSSDWFRQFIQRVKAFIVKIWNEDSPKTVNAAKVSEEPQEVSKEIVISQEHPVEDNRLGNESQVDSDTQGEDVLRKTMGSGGEENLQETADIQQEEMVSAQGNTDQGMFVELLRPLLDVIKRFLAEPFSDEPLVPKKQESYKEQQKYTTFAEYAAQNGWDDKAVAHQMQVKSQPWETYNKKGEHTQMTKEAPSNLSIKR